MLRGQLLTLVNGYSFTRVTELSSLHIWRRRKTKSWVRTQPNPFLCKEEYAWKHFLLHTKDKNPGRKKSLVMMGSGPDHLPSRCQCRRVLRGKLLALVNGYPFTRVTEWSSLHSGESLVIIEVSCALSRAHYYCVSRTRLPDSSFIGTMCNSMNEKDIFFRGLWRWWHQQRKFAWYFQPDISAFEWQIIIRNK